ncbi:MAG TPA: FAD-dependent oxidoreductase [Polyangiaceae bacterium]
MKLRVAVLGGGMGGLACAHELARTGIDVTVYEASSFLGGKARSHYVAGTGTQGRRDLPGEHGFRFYPGFYRHVIQSMREIPDPLSPTGTVDGNLVSVDEAGVALPGEGIVTSPRRARTLGDARRAIDSIRRSGGSPSDLALYLAAHLKYLTACDARREGEIERTPWAEFIGAHAPGRYTESFREVLLACTRTMVAMDAERGSSRTVGQTSSLLLMDSFAGNETDRTMMGPTTECWIEPWEKHLRARGVSFVFGHRIERLEHDGRRITRVWATAADGRAQALEADAFVLAVPIEAAQRLAGESVAGVDAELAKVARCDLSTTTTWMVGAQYFLREDVPLCEGHLFFPQSPWSLTAISQAQFWNRGNRAMARYADGHLRGIVSVDVSSCFSPDRDGVRLVDARSTEEILARTRIQLQEALDGPTRRAFERAVYAANLDHEVRVGPDGVKNAGRLLIHPPGSRAERPDASTTFENLYLASDYVKTEMDLASMESANEAGRRAARAVLLRAGEDPACVQLFGYHEVDGFRIPKRVDEWLHARGMPHALTLIRRFAETQLGLWT